MISWHFKFWSKNYGQKSENQHNDKLVGKFFLGIIDMYVILLYSLCIFVCRHLPSADLDWQNNMQAIVFEELLVYKYFNQSVATSQAHVMNKRDKWFPYGNHNT